MEKYIAYCGLDCETCEARIATIYNDDAQRKKVAGLWSELNGTEITPEDVETLRSCGDSAADFCVKCTRQLRKYYQQKYGRDAYGVIDALVMTAALYPEIMQGAFKANCAVELSGSETRGYFRIDRRGQLGLAPNATVCPAVDVALFKKHLFTLLGAG